MTYYKVGYYKPSFEFTHIPEFMAILDKDGNLMGVTGSATSRQAALDARLFAAAPDLLLALKRLCLNLKKESTPGLISEEASLSEALVQAFEVIKQVENGNRPVNTISSSS